MPERRAASASEGSTLQRGRSAYERRAWRAASALLAASDREHPLDAIDLERLAFAGYLSGQLSEYADYLTRAHHLHLTAGDVERAARTAFFLGMSLLDRGEQARAGGWLARAQRLIEESDRDCVERGYVIFPTAVRCVYSGEAERAYELFTRAAEIAARFRDPDLTALARHGQGRALIRQGDVARGVACLDEAMVAIEANEVSPTIAGAVYCSVLEACTEIFDVRRAQEWTTSLTRWCESQPDLVLFRGQCMVRRAELLQLRGSWSEALEETQLARTRLSEPPPPQPAVGLALYLEAELHRLRGEYETAETLYREASKWGRKPRPGLALLRLAQGQIDVAQATIRALVAEAHDIDARARVLAAQVEIELAAGEVETARAAADELASIAAQLDAPLLRALAMRARGAVLLAKNDARAALPALQEAWSGWQELEAPHDAARVRVLIAEACRALGDDASAELELEAARSVFEQLGANPEIERLPEISSTARPDAGGLTARELQVLRLVAQGKTNKAIASDLFISEKTVHRHVSNIFLKLGLSSRAAATAYAFQHHLV